MEKNTAVWAVSPAEEAIQPGVSAAERARSVAMTRAAFQIGIMKGRSVKPTEEKEIPICPSCGRHSKGWRMCSYCR
jgi:hypothetical protein